MTGQIKFSVVISAYNVEEYLPGLLQDLLEQTYNNFEVILVDDCATDQTGEVAESYLQAFRGKQADYVVIHKPENEGLSMARNTGISHAAGDYILFLDADDGVEKTLLERLYHALDEQPADMVVVGYTEDYYQKNALSYQVQKTPELYYFSDHIHDGAQGWKRPLAYAYPYIIELEHETMFGYAWNKAYRLSFLQEQKLQFQNIVHIEDILFNVQAAGALQSLLTLPDVLYHYANRGQSRLTDKYLPEYFALQKTRVQAFLNMQMRKIQTVTEGMTKGETGGLENLDVGAWRMRLHEVMAGVYFRSFQSSMVRGIQHGDSKREVMARARAELEGPLYGRLRRHLSEDGRVAKILYAPLVRGDISGAYRRAKEIAWAKEHMAGAYVKLKQNR